jgi:hypothetical protein
MNHTGARIDLADINDVEYIAILSPCQIFGSGHCLTSSTGYITKADLADDGIHPTNAGYRKMAAVWNAAIAKVQAAHFLQDPENTGTPDDAPDNRCEKIPGHADGPHVTQKGYGFGDGPYRHKSTKIDHLSLSSHVQNKGYEKHLAFAQIVNAGGNPDPKGALDDLLIWLRYPDGLRIHVWINSGNGEFHKESARAILPIDCPSEDVRWADISFTPSTGATSKLLQAQFSLTLVFQVNGMQIIPSERVR